MHVVVADQGNEVVARLDAACPRIGVVVDAHLVERRGIDAVEPVRHLAKLQGAGVLDDGGRGPAWTCPEDDGQDRHQKTRTWSGWWESMLGGCRRHLPVSQVARGLNEFIRYLTTAVISRES
jgi:hypothetical protein